MFGKYFVRCLAFAVISITLLSNSFSSTHTYGSLISNQGSIPIVEVFDHSDKYNGKTITLKGMINMQDEKGHWFYLQDEEARIYVDLYDAGFVIPDLMNKTVLVEGKVEVKMNIPSLMATGVECRE